MAMASSSQRKYTIPAVCFSEPPTPQVTGPPNPQGQGRRRTSEEPVPRASSPQGQGQRRTSEEPVPRASSPQGQGRRRTSEEPAPRASSPQDPKEYPEEEWKAVAEAIAEADTGVADAKARVLQATAMYETALKVRTRLVRNRDAMIVSDPRTSAALGRISGVTRGRVSQVRSAAGRRRADGVLPGSDSARLLGMVDAA